MGRIKDIADATDGELQAYLDALGWEQNPFTHAATLDEYVLPSAEDIADVSSQIQNYTGPVLVHSQYSGVGKTTLLRQLLEEFDDEYTTVYVGEHNVTPYELVAIVADAIGVGKSSSTKLTEQKIEDADLNQDILLGIDEFGLNDPDTLHVIQFLNDLDAFKVVLTGMTSQWDAIGGLGSDGRAFQRRVGYKLELEPLSREQTTELVQRRIATGEGRPHSEYNQIDITPFSERLLSEVYDQSSGVPAVITTACAELVSLGAYHYAQTDEVDIPVEYADSVEYRDAKVE